MHSPPEFSKSSPAAAAAAGTGTARGRGSVPDSAGKSKTGTGLRRSPISAHRGPWSRPRPPADKSGTGPQPAGGVRAAWPPCPWGQLSDNLTDKERR